MSGAIVVTGTDTGIGKTVFAAGLAVLLGARYWKPIQSGLADETDAQAVERLGVLAADIRPEAYRLTQPLSPHRSAEIDGVRIDPALLALPETAGRLIVEGAGGVLVPLTRDLLFADLFARWGRPTVLVARTCLGTVNHSLLALEALRARGVPILGIAFIGDPVEDSEATIAAIGKVKRLGRLPHLPSLTADTLHGAFQQSFRHEDFA